MIRFHKSVGQKPGINITKEHSSYEKKLFIRIKVKIMFEKQLLIYDQIVAKCSRFKRKGKTVPYTSANGYMFSLLNKKGEIGIRYSKEVQTKYIEKFNSSNYRSHNAIMKGYVLIPADMLKDADLVAQYLDESYDYVMSLPKK